MPKVRRGRLPYSVHPAVAMMQRWIAELPAKTGRTLDDWIDVVKERGPADTKARRAWLKEEFGLAHAAQMLITERAEKGHTGIMNEDPEAYLQEAEGYVEAMYAGPKAALRPIYDRLLEIGLGLGDDVRACPCQTIVPLYREHVFAQIKPSTKTRIDLGLAFKDAPAEGRLIDTGGFAKKDRITHRVAISHLDEIDDEVVGLLRRAYDLALPSRNF